MNSAATATVRIQRASALNGVLRDFKVLVDDREVTRVGNGATVDLVVPPGVHSFSVKIDWYHSKRVTLDLASGDVVALHCGFASGLGGLLSSLTSTDSYLFLRHEGVGLVAAAPPRAAPSRTVPADSVVVSLSERVERVPAATEDVRVPPGVTVKVKRSRTFEHTVDIDWSVGGSLQVDVGLKSVLGGSIRGEISRKQGTGEKESETVEYEVELKGDSSRQYKLAWTDVWRAGVAEVRQGTSTHALPFRYREKTELEVLPVAVGAA